MGTHFAFDSIQIRIKLSYFVLMGALSSAREPHRQISGKEEDGEGTTRNNAMA